MKWTCPTLTVILFTVIYALLQIFNIIQTREVIYVPRGYIIHRIIWTNVLQSEYTAKAALLKCAARCPLPTLLFLKTSQHNILTALRDLWPAVSPESNFNFNIFALHLLVAAAASLNRKAKGDSPKNSVPKGTGNLTGEMFTIYILLKHSLLFIGRYCCGLFRNKFYNLPRVHAGPRPNREARSLIQRSYHQVYCNMAHPQNMGHRHQADHALLFSTADANTISGI